MYMCSFFKPVYFTYVSTLYLPLKLLTQVPPMRLYTLY